MRSFSLVATFLLRLFCIKNEVKIRFLRISYIIAAGMFLLAVVTSCSKEKDESMVMTMTINASGKVTIGLAGTGLATIDWGDGSETDTKELCTICTFSPIFIDNAIFFKHDYSGTNTRIIKIYGDNITKLICGYMELSNLDVSKNTKLDVLFCSYTLLKNLDVSKNADLTYLCCDNNQLSSLDVSNNTALTLLNCTYNQLTKLNVHGASVLRLLACDNNQLTSLDVSQNTVLEVFHFSNNQFTSMDVSKNTVLYELICRNNQLTAVTLDALFETLHDNTVPFRTTEKQIIISNNPGIDDCDPNIAKKKGWKVYTE